MAAKTESGGGGGEVKKVLSAVNDHYGGVIVHVTEHMEPTTFVSSLTSSIAHWMLQVGFWYHHAEPDYLMLVHWIPQSPHTLPTNATHRVGIGALLINQNIGVLVVQEKGGQYRGTGLWKLPIGVVDEGEDIFAAAVREVKEETEIDSELWKFSRSGMNCMKSLSINWVEPCVSL